MRKPESEVRERIMHLKKYLKLSLLSLYPSMSGKSREQGGGGRGGGK